LDIKYEIRDRQCTCGACPTQYEGHLTDGRMFYIRYRYGRLAFNVSPEPTDDVYDAVRAPPIFKEQVGDTLDGCIAWCIALDVLNENGVILLDSKK